MLCSVSRVQCRRAGRAALDPEAQPSHLGRLPAHLLHHRPVPETQARMVPNCPLRGSRVTGAHTPLQDMKPQIPGTSSWGRDRSKFQEIPEQGWGVWDGEEVPTRGSPAPGPGHLAIRLSLQGYPPTGTSLTPGSETGREESWSTAHTLRGSQAGTALLAPPHLPFSEPAHSGDIFCPLMRWGLSSERR